MDKDIKEKVIKNIFKLLKQKGLKKIELANYLNVHDSTISAWVNGRNTPDISTLYKICKFLNVQINTLFEEKEINNNYYALNEENKKIIDIIITKFINTQK